MSYSCNISPKLLAIITIFAVTILRIDYVFNHQFQLFFDEAQYWTWSKNLDWGYFSKPPIIAWLIAATTQICGDATGCIRLSAPILHLFTSLIIYASARRLFDDKTAFWSAIIYCTLPGVSIGSAFISSDAPLMFFWGLSFYCLVRAINEDGYRWWILLGIASGLGMMSKYTMVIFFISALAFFIHNKQHRQLIISPKTWLTIATSIIIFLPNILWNISNDFISISHTNENVLDSGRFALHFTDTIEFLGAQIFIFGPLLFFFLIYLMPRADKIFKNEQTSLLFYFTFTLFFIAIIVSLISGAQAHWAAPIYITGSILTSYFIVNSKIIWLAKTSLVINIIILLLFININQLQKTTNLLDKVITRIDMWSNAAYMTGASHLIYNDAIIASDERKAVASLMYKLRDKDNNPALILKWNKDKDFDDYYDMRTNMNDYKGRNFLMLTRSNIDGFKDYFADTKIAHKFTIGTQKFTIVYLQNFKGY